jgi:hypothetical protein
VNLGAFLDTLEKRVINNAPQTPEAAPLRMAGDDSGQFVLLNQDTGDTQAEEPEYEVEAEVVAPDPGSIAVTVKGGGAVALDGAARGTVPAYGTLNLKGVAPGWHTVSVGNESKTVEVTPGGVAKVELEGAPPAPVAQAPAAPAVTHAPTPTEPPAATPTGKGFMQVESDRYAMIYMGGQRLGGTPVARMELEPGTYAIRAVCRETGASQSKQVEVKPGELITANFKFLP